MEPQEWQRLAEELASDVASELEGIEGEFWPDPSDPSFRSFWPRIRMLSERLRTAPAIDIENKLQLLGRVRRLTKRARQDQEVYFAEQRHRKAETLDRIEELRSQALESSRPEESHPLRQQLAAMRDAVSEMELPTRGDRQEVWDAWRAASRQLWDHLSGQWAANETALAALLDEARKHLDRGQIRETRELVRRFNAQSREREVSHKSGRVLRGRANTLWREASEVAQAKHEAFVATAPARVERWKQVKGRNASAIAKLRAEVAELEHNIDSGGVAAAFARAMIDEKLRELGRLESTIGSLDDRIEDAEAALVSR